MEHRAKIIIQDLLVSLISKDLLKLSLLLHHVVEFFAFADRSSLLDQGLEQIIDFELMEASGQHREQWAQLLQKLCKRTIGPATAPEF